MGWTLGVRLWGNPRRGLPAGVCSFPLLLGKWAPVALHPKGILSLLRNLNEPLSPSASEKGCLNGATLTSPGFSYCFKACGVVKEETFLDPRPRYETVQGQLRRCYLSVLRGGQRPRERAYFPAVRENGLCLKNGLFLKKQWCLLGHSITYSIIIIFV